MFSSKDKIPVTRLLVYLNLGVHFAIYGYLLSNPANVFHMQDFYNRYGLVPAVFWDQAAVWQPLTSMFLHGIFFTAGEGGNPPGLINMFFNFASLSLIHVAVNMIALRSLGGLIEKTIGSVHHAFLYFISGGTAALLTLIKDMDQTHPTIGASGAICGILGAMAVFYPNARLLVFFIPMKARTAAIGLGVISFVLMVWGGGGVISHTGHLGGLVGGFLYARFALRSIFRREQLGPYPADGITSGVHRLFRRSHGESSIGNFGSTDMPGGPARTPEDLSTGKQGAPEVIAGETKKGEGRTTDGREWAGEEETERAEGQDRQRLYYDPQTGRFFYQ